jgi:hypothetical protein
MPQLVEVEKSPGWEKAFRNKTRLKFDISLYKLLKEYPYEEGFPDSADLFLLILADGRLEFATVNTASKEKKWEVASSNHLLLCENFVAGWHKISETNGNAVPNNDKWLE